MAKHKRKAFGGRPSHTSKKRRPSRKNPGFRGARHHKRYRRNPSRTGGMAGIFEQGAFAIGGAAASKYLAQMILGASNSGFMGYGANLAIGFALGKAVQTFTKNAAFGNAVILGAVIQTMTRALLDNTTVGSSLGLSGVGDYVAQATIIPPTLVPGTRFTYADPFAAQHQMIAAPSMPAAAQAKLNGYGRRIGQSGITAR